MKERLRVLRRRVRVSLSAAADSRGIQRQRFAVHRVAGFSALVSAMLADHDLLESTANSLIIATRLDAARRPRSASLSRLCAVETVVGVAVGSLYLSL
jgi:hypothetical protein